MNNQTNKNIIIILLIIIIIILTGLCILFASNTISLNINKINNDPQKTPTQNELGKYDTFSTKNNSGIVEVIGYPETKELKDEMYNHKKYNYVYFHIKETKSDEFKKYISSLNGNTFVLDDAIGLGCIIDQKINYYNISDELNNKKYELSQEDSDKILNATENNPIKLKLEKLPLTTGGGAPMCYSHITTIKIEN